MKNIQMIRSLLVICLFCSCTKSFVEQPVTIENNTKKTESETLIRNINGTTLTVTMTPEVVCYSYKDGETPKPCNIFVDLTCELSGPINGTVMVEIDKMNLINNSQGANSIRDTSDIQKTVINIAPNTTHITMRSNFTNPNNLDIAELFSFGNVEVYNKVQ